MHRFLGMACGMVLGAGMLLCGCESSAVQSSGADINQSSENGSSQGSSMSQNTDSTSNPALNDGVAN